MNIAFIPIRCGSKSIPLKNIKEFCGEPLVYWNLKALQDSKYIDEVYVATDCNEIKSIINGFNFSKVKTYDRDIENASDVSSTESVILEFLSKNSFRNDDNFILVQATSPFTQAKDFDNALEYINNKKKDSLLSCSRIKRFFLG
eukprot:Anaeramoba_flamelloidesc40952_g1_i1.p3 GENE.c40952_g1_i1~~c40952_g1_i1.p3  ORF type:complete len:144 (+),score=9.12 c40952_g1_i1:1444-1875(+)